MPDYYFSEHDVISSTIVKLARTRLLVLDLVKSRQKEKMVRSYPSTLQLAKQLLVVYVPLLVLCET